MLKTGYFWRGSRVDICGEAQEWIFLPQTQFLPLEELLTPLPNSRGWVLQIDTAKGSWMIQISDPASRFQRSGVQDCKPSADTAEQSASACAEPRACEGRL